MQETKAALRRRLGESRGEPEKLCQRLLGLPWFQEARVVMAYVAVPPEPDLGMVLEATLAQGKTLLLPRCEPGDRLTARRVTDLEGLRPGAYGIPEPPDPGAGGGFFPYWGPPGPRKGLL
jgi:5-formyltetrahydrofolate cyclo-ligase